MISMQLRFFPWALIREMPRESLPEPGRSELIVFTQVFSVLARFPIVFAGAAGLFLCLRNRTNAAHRVFLFVCVPALAGLIALSVRFLAVAADLDRQTHLIGFSARHNSLWAFGSLWSLGPAFHAIVVGAILILLFESRLAMGLTSLPLSVAPGGIESAQADDRWRRIMLFVWFAIYGWTLFAGISIAVIVAYKSNSPFVATLMNYVALVGLIALVAWAVGPAERAASLRMFRLAPVHFAVLGFAIPAVINLIPGLAAFALDRFRWAQLLIGTAFVPVINSYFRLPNLQLLWLLPAAGLEEIVWRAFLQPVFVKRYGMIRGIFLVGIVWSAYHFMGDFRGASDLLIPVRFIERFAVCIPLGFVLGWLTLRSRSVWPAMLAHGFYNIFVSASPNLEQSLKFPSWVLVGACYGVIGYILFRLWPPEDEQGVGARGSEEVTSIQVLEGEA